MRRSTTEQRARTNRTTTTKATVLLFTGSAATRLDGEALQACFAAIEMKVCENWVTGVVAMCGYYHYYSFIYLFFLNRCLLTEEEGRKGLLCSNRRKPTMTRMHCGCCLPRPHAPAFFTQSSGGTTPWLVKKKHIKKQHDFDGLIRKKF